MPDEWTPPDGWTLRGHIERFGGLGGDDPVDLLNPETYQADAEGAWLRLLLVERSALEHATLTRDWDLAGIVLDRLDRLIDGRRTLDAFPPLRLPPAIEALLREEGPLGDQSTDEGNTG